MYVPLHFQEHKWKENITEKNRPISRGLTFGLLTAMNPLASSNGFGPSSTDKSNPTITGT